MRGKSKSSEAQWSETHQLEPLPDDRLWGSEKALLRALGLFDSRIQEPELVELSEVLRADYREAPGLPAPEKTRKLVALAKSGLDPRRQAWRKWHNSESFRIRPRQLGGKAIAVHAEPYTRGAGLLLWGFSCDAHIGGSGAFIIFLNTAHQPGAVAATVAHELGHYIYRSIAPDACDTMAPLAANFASHLEDDAELFSDSLAALSAYNPGQLARIRPPRAACGGVGEIVAALNAIDPEYRIDFSNPTISPAWRIKYLASSIHFYKLRRALQETAGI